MAFWNIDNDTAQGTILATDGIKLFFGAILNTIPLVGGILSGILGLFMPGSSTTYLFDQLRKELEEFVNQKIGENDWNLLSGKVSELTTKMGTMKDLLSLGDYEGAHLLYQNISSFVIGEEENFKVAEYEFLLLPLFCTFIAQVAAFRFECIFNGDKFNLTNDEIDREKLLLQDLIYGTSITDGAVKYIASFIQKGKFNTLGTLEEYNKRCTEARIYCISCVEVIDSILEAMPADIRNKELEDEIYSEQNNNAIGLPAFYHSQIYYIDASPRHNEPDEITYWNDMQKNIITYFTISPTSFPLEKDIWKNIYMKEFKLYATSHKIIAGWEISYYDSYEPSVCGDISLGSIVKSYTFTKEKQPTHIEITKTRVIPNPSSSDRIDLRIGRILLQNEDGEGIYYDGGIDGTLDYGDPIVFNISDRRIPTLKIYVETTDGVTYGLAAAFIYVPYQK